MKDTRDIVVPIINLNGNGKKDLMDKLEKAFDAVNEAIVAVSETSDIGHGRNHFDAEKARKAYEEHRERMVKLHEVKEEIGELAYQISLQGR